MFLLLKPKNILLKKSFSLLSRYSKYNFFFNLFYIMYCSIFLKNIKFISDTIGKNLGVIYQKYKKYFDFLTDLSLYFFYIIFINYILGLRIQIKGKVKGRKKNMASSFLITKGSLYLKSTSFKLSSGSSISLTKYGILGIKFWVSYFLINNK